jgi:hypothetical protein
MNPRADPPVGHPAARVTTTTRRGTPWQDQSPSFLWPPASAGTAAFSQGHPPAHPRHAISTREHQTGGAPTRSAPTRRGYPHPRPPPTQPGDRLTRRVKTVRPRADALRALRLDPTGRRRLSCTGRGARPQPTNQYSITVVLDSAVPHQESGSGHHSRSRQIVVDRWARMLRRVAATGVVGVENSIRAA